MSSEYSNASEETNWTVNEITRHGRHGIMSYATILLDVDYPTFSDVYDPDMLIIKESATVHWGQTSTSASGRTYETVMLGESRDAAITDEELADNAIISRHAILAASIGQATLDRLPPDLWPARAQHDEDIMKMLQFSGAPMSVCQISTVFESGIIPVGSRCMHLFYPYIATPGFVLNGLQTEIRRTMLTEDPGGA